MPASFASIVKGFSKEAEMSVEKVVRAFALEVTRRVVLRSPVKTGHFRSSWQIGIEQEPTGNASGDPMSDAKAKLSTWKLRGQKTIFVTNNLPYAWRLEFGWSKQAPSGMARITVAEGYAIMAKVAKETLS